MIKHLLFLTTLMLFGAISKGQTQITFQKTYGVGHGNSVQQTYDKGFIIAGYAPGNGSIVSLIKADANGVIQWSESFSEGNYSITGYFVQQTNDSGFIIVGSTTKNYDILLLKISSSGTLQWSKSFGGTSEENAFCVRQTSDGGFIIAGKTFSFGAGGYDVYLIKTTSDGTLQWTKTFGGVNWEKGLCVRQTNDGGYIVAGDTESFGAGRNDVYLVKTDSFGNLLWTKTFGGTNIDYGNSIEQTTDGGYIIIGMTASFGAGSEDVYLIKTDSNGTLQWTKTFGGTEDEWGYSIQQTNDKGYIITGYTSSFGAGNTDVYLIKTDSVGSLQWSKTFGGTQGENGYCVAQTQDGGFIISAFTTSSFALYTSDIYLIKTDSKGNSGCNETSPTSIEGSGGAVGTGGIEGTGGTTDSIIIGTNFGSQANTICTTVGVNEIPKKAQIYISPNPFSSTTTLQINRFLKDAIIKVFDSYGQIEKQLTNISGQKVTLQRENLTSGLYFLQIIQDNKILITSKFIITDY